jgi:hypothetical protein
MKKSFLFYILACVTSFISFTSCEDVNDQSNHVVTPNDNIPISTRGNCDLCPDDDECCCAVWLQPGSTAATLTICGTSNGAAACIGSGTVNCPSFSGGGVLATLTSGSPSQPFCLNEGTPFYIRNGGMSTANIIVSCQVDITMAPDTMWLQIPVNATVYIQGNSSCVLEPC